MIPDRDHYADKHGKLTDDPDQYASQIAVRGCFLDDRVARRFGITDMLVSTAEPNTTRRVSGRSAASLRITKAEEKEAPTQDQPQEPAEAAEPTAESEPEAIATGKDKPKPSAAKKEK